MPEPELRALTALRRLRRVETDGARRDLGEAVAQELALMERSAAIERDVAEGLRVVGDFDRQAFAAWFARMRIQQAALADAIETAVARTAAAPECLPRTMRWLSPSSAGSMLS